MEFPAGPREESESDAPCVFTVTWMNMYSTDVSV